MIANPYVRSQNQCDFHDVDCECLVGHPCQLTPPERPSEILARAERLALDLVAALVKVQQDTPSGAGLANVTGVVQAAKTLESMVHELRRDMAA